MAIKYRAIRGHPNYRVGVDGSVWSSAYGSWRKLKPSREKYARVYLGGIHYYIHRLVLEAFVGPCPQGMEACHFPDGNKLNNRLDNLRWATHRANIADKVVQGTHLRGERNHKCKLSARQVKAIRSIYAAGGVQQSDIAAMYRVTRQLIWRIINNKCWAHLY